MTSMKKQQKILITEEESENSVVHMPIETFKTIMQNNDMFEQYFDEVITLEVELKLEKCRLAEYVRALDNLKAKNIMLENKQALIEKRYKELGGDIEWKKTIKRFIRTPEEL